MSRFPASILQAAILFLLTFIAAPAQQTGVWETVDETDILYNQAFVAYNNVLSCASEQDIVVIGTLNQIPLPKLLRRSTDGGLTWNELKSETQYGETWKSVAHPSPDLIVVVGDSAQLLEMDGSFNKVNKYKGVMLRSADGGATWTTFRGDSNTFFNDISMCNPQHGVIVQWNISNKYNEEPAALPDCLLRTTDGWQTWTSVALPPGVKYASKVICVQPDVYILNAYDVAQKFSVILRTTDGGTTWQKSGSLPIHFMSMTFIDPLRGWAAGGIRTGMGDRQRDVIVRTTDGGMTWTKQIDKEIGLIPFGLTNVDFVDENNGIATGRADKLLRTRDGGQTWVQEFPSSDIKLPYPPMYIEFVKPDFAIVVYNGAAIIRYTGRQTLLPPSFIQPATIGPQDVDNITLEWTPIEGATEYHIMVAPQPLSSGTYDSTVYKNSILDATITGTSTVLNGLQYDHRYYVRVKAKNATQESDWHRREGLFYTKKNAGSVAPPKVLTPEYQAENQPTTVTITWQDIPGAVSYDLQVSEELIFPAPLLAANVTGHGTTSYTVADLKAATMYYVRVRANLPTQTTPWSSVSGVHFFTTGSQTGSVQHAEAAASAKMSIFPNPVTGDATVHLHGLVMPGNARLEICNALGERVHVVDVGESRSIRIPTADLAAGTYHVRLLGAGGVTGAPMVVVR